MNRQTKTSDKRESKQSKKNDKHNTDDKNIKPGNEKTDDGEHSKRTGNRNSPVFEVNGPAEKQSD